MRACVCALARAIARACVRVRVLGEVVPLHVHTHMLFFVIPISDQSNTVSFVTLLIPDWTTARLEITHPAIIQSLAAKHPPNSVQSQRWIQWHFCRKHGAEGCLCAEGNRGSYRNSFLWTRGNVYMDIINVRVVVMRSWFVHMLRVMAVGQLGSFMV